MAAEIIGLERWPGYDEQSWQQRFFELDRQHSKLHADYHRTLLAALAGSSAKVEEALRAALTPIKQGCDASQWHDVNGERMKRILVANPALARIDAALSPQGTP